MKIFSHPELSGEEFSALTSEQIEAVIVGSTILKPLAQPTWEDLGY